MVSKQDIYFNEFDPTTYVDRACFPDYQKNYREKNKHRKYESKQDYYKMIGSKKETCVCGVTHTRSNRTAHIKTKGHLNFIIYGERKINKNKYQKEYYEKNKDSISEKYKKYYDDVNSELIKCECGYSYRKLSKKQHDNTQRHKYFIQFGVKKETIKSQTVQCYCGMKYKTDFKKHEESSTHQEFLKYGITHHGRNKVCECRGKYLKGQYEIHCQTKRHKEYENLYDINNNLFPFLCI